MANIVISEPLRYDLVIYRGDTGRFMVTVTDGSGFAADLSDAVWDCDVRSSVDATEPIVSLPVTPVAGDPSSIEIIIDAATSALLGTAGGAVWDLQMTHGTGVQTLVSGTVRVTKDVSR